MKKTNFDRYLEEQLRDPAFAARFERAGEAWDVALQVAALRQEVGLSQWTWQSCLRRPSSKSAGWSRPATKDALRVCCAGLPASYMPGCASYSSREERERDADSRIRRNVPCQIRDNQTDMNRIKKNVH
jgi:hypothetical protein